MQTCLKLVVLFIYIATTASALTNETSRITTGLWQQSDDNLGFIVNLSPNVSARQRDLIGSGFTTFSHLKIYKQPDSPRNEPDVLFEITCTVKFDLWHERYDIVVIGGEQNHTMFVEEFRDYAEVCLRAQLSHPEIIERISSQNTSLLASLQIDQISASKANEIREWLVRQQAGVMRGIFAHMLGEIRLAENIIVSVEIPPLLVLRETLGNP